MNALTWTTTLAEIRKHHPCVEGWEKLLKHLGVSPTDAKKDTQPISILTILESNGIDDALWSFLALSKDHESAMRLYAEDCAERVLHLFEAEYPDDSRPREAIDAARKFARGEIDDAAWAAARDAAWAAAWAAARDAAWAAARDAAGDAAWGAARDAAWAAARAAAGDAAGDAAWAAAGDAAWAAAWAAARDAAGDAAGDAARDAAWGAERDWQAQRLREIIGETS